MWTATVFLDCAAGIAVNSTGVSHPDVVQAICDQAEKFIHMSGTDFYYEPQVRLAEELASIVPIDGGVRTFFGNSGTEATEAAIKLSRYHTKRPGHHRVPWVVPWRSLGLAVADREQGDPAPRVRSVDAGCLSRALSGPYRFKGSADACAEECLVVHSRSDCWSISLPLTKSPPSSSNRFRAKAVTSFPPSAFLQGLRELATQHGIMLVVDEVQSGMGRTGKMLRPSTSA